LPAFYGAVQPQLLGGVPPHVPLTPHATQALLLQVTTPHVSPWHVCDVQTLESCAPQGTLS
jgi:hypothetical protein